MKMPSPPQPSFEEVYRQSFARLVGQLTLVTGDVESASDAVQEAMYKAWVRWSKVASYEDPAGWIRRVALNEATSCWRKIRRLIPAGEADPPADSDSLEMAPETLDLMAAIRRLPIRQRQALVLFYLADLPIKDVAQEMSVREGTAKSLLSRGRISLSQLLPETASKGEADARA
ncbi:MAG TPA: SigE family RNA polymerase sigma factor [Acidimicrobiales bacterium]|jgi:RNA polymerase sigma-70 factor (ECF subfamily)